MLLRFFLHVRRCGIPITIREWLDLLSALHRGLIFADMDQFYDLSKIILVKDERHFDKFDVAFSSFFQGMEGIENLFEELIPDEWLRKELENMLTEEEKASIQNQGGLEALLKTFQQRLAEQSSRHQGGNKWIGTGGTSPFGAWGFHPSGFRIEGESRHRKAIKVWHERRFRDLDDSIELGTRTIKMALRKLRRLAREGSIQELDVDATIHATADNGGVLDLKMHSERRNAIKVLLFFDVGGSMDSHVALCEELFSAARSEFKSMDWFYFHNCIYEAVWTNNLRRPQDIYSSWELIRTYSREYRVIFVGDAAMSPYELTAQGGNLEGWNQESGQVWLTRLLGHFDKCIWLNPIPRSQWEYAWTTTAINYLMNDRMFELSLSGIEKGIAALSR